MKCPDCGKSIPNNSRYCPYNGTKIPIVDILLNRLSSLRVPIILLILPAMLFIGLVMLFIGYVIWKEISIVETTPTIISSETIEEPPPAITDEPPPAIADEPPPVITEPSTSIWNPKLTPNPISEYQSIESIDMMQSKIAFVVEYGKGDDVETELYTIDQSRKPELITKQQGRISAPSWSPNGSQISFYLNSGGKFLTVVKAKPNASLNKLTECGWNSWSPDGRQIACRYEDYGTAFIKFVDTATGGVTDTIGIGTLRTLDWSPTREEFVYSAGNGYNTQIWRISMDRESAKSLTEFGCPSYDPNFSPDGKWIVYRSDCENAGREIWIMDREGNDKQRVTSTDGWSDSPDWSPDGNYIAFVSSQADSAGSMLGDLFILSLIDGTVEKLPSTSGRVSNWGVSWGE